MPPTTVKPEPVNGAVAAPEGTRYSLSAVERMAMQGLAARDRELGRLAAELRADQEALSVQIGERLAIPADEIAGPAATWQLDQATWALVKAAPPAQG